MYFQATNQNRQTGLNSWQSPHDMRAMGDADDDVGIVNIYKADIKTCFSKECVDHVENIVASLM